MHYTEQIIMANESFLKGVIFNKSGQFSNLHNQLLVDELIQYVNHIRTDDWMVDDNTILKLLYHFITNVWSHSPYPNFEPGLYQNAYPENNDDAEEVKFLLCKICGYDTNFFNEDVKEKHKDFNLSFSWVY